MCSVGGLSPAIGRPQGIGATNGGVKSITMDNDVARAACPPPSRCIGRMNADHKGLRRELSRTIGATFFAKCVKIFLLDTNQLFSAPFPTITMNEQNID